MKTLLSLLLVIILCNITIAQTTSIPDVNFEQALIDLGYDNGVLDGSVPTINIDTITILYVNNKNISNITGIEDFTALTYLNCDSNSISSINMSQNTTLTNLYCNYNQLTSIDVTQNTSLTQLDCGNNQLTSIDVTQNINLIHLGCGSNQLTTIDVSQNTLLSFLYCAFNQITSLDVSQNHSLAFLSCWFNNLTCLNVKNGNNTAFWYFCALNNTNLTCINVDDVAWSSSNWTLAGSNVDAGVYFSTNCGNSCSVGIDEQSLSTLLLYPNPTSNQLSIGTELEISEITIIDITGEIITTTKQNTNVVNVADLSNGIYFIKLTSDERTITKKFVKQ